MSYCNILFTTTVLLFRSSITSACGSGVGNNDYEILKDPVFMMDVSPPVSWTYFTPAMAATTLNFFVGQSNDSATAKSRADTEIQAAMILALTEAQIFLQNVMITNDFQPEELPQAATGIVAGQKCARLEGGAITGVSTACMIPPAVTVFTAYSKQVDVSVRNVQATRYTWNIVKNTFVQKLSLNYRARFLGDITVGNTG